MPTVIKAAPAALNSSDGHISRIAPAMLLTRITMLILPNIQFWKTQTTLKKAIAAENRSIIMSKVEPIKRIPGEKIMKNGNRYATTPNRMATKAVSQIFAPAIEAPAKTAKQTGGVIIDRSET